MRRINIVIDPELDDRLEREAAARNTSKSAVVRECVERGLTDTTPQHGLRWIGELSAEFADVEPVDDIDEFLYGPLWTGRMIFVDSSYWIAQMLPRDGRHREAARLGKAYDLQRLVTSSTVLAETWTFLRRRSGHRDAIGWLDRVLGATNVRCERVDERVEAEAWAWLRVHDERSYSFVDATSFAVMRKKRINDALAFDGDFAAAGFNELRA